mgnify:FL=1
MQTVSVIIPTYKNRGGLVKSIDSVLSQDYEGQLEVIVVDDNDPLSSFRKETELLMSKYKDDGRVRYLRHEINKNGAAARNTGIRASKGDYIAFLDDDDLFLKDKLKKQVAYLDSHKEFDAVYCLARRDKYSCSQKVIEGNGTRDILLLESNFFTPSLMFRRKALENINGFDESFRRHQDYELLLRYFAAGYKIGCVPEILIEIGLNKGENSPRGSRLNELKDYFFLRFKDFIVVEDNKTPGFANQVYAKHYAGVFLSHLKNGYWKMALEVFFKYMPKSPTIFLSVLKSHLLSHVNTLKK